MGAKFIEDSTWHGVTDPKKRKQIQDRLAQRARSTATDETDILTFADHVSPQERKSLSLNPGRGLLTARATQQRA